MRAIVLSAKGRVELRDVPEPAIVESTDAIARVRLAGICGTDLHLIGGEYSGMEPGTILGHEFVGEIVEIGRDVRRFRIGDRVGAVDFTACGHCRWCERGDHWECAERAFFGSGAAFGSALAGAQAEYVRIPLADVTAFAIPKGCSDASAILVADNLPTAWAAVDLGPLAAGETVAVVGGGPIGQLASLCAGVCGAGAIVVSEPSAERRAFATTRGAIAVTPDECERVVRDVTSGDGADLVIEAVGHPRGLDAALSIVRKRGRVVSVGAHGAEAWSLPLARSFASELSLRFAIGNSYRYRRTLLGLIARGVLEPDDVIDTRVSFADAPLAYERMSRQEILKATIDPSA